MRIRTIKPEFWSSLTVSELPVAARLTFIGLWNYADDEGRGVFDPRLIRAAIWPLEDNVTVAKVQGHLDALTAARLITVYSDGTRTYFSVNGWGEHQAISHPRPSLLPAPSLTLPGTLPEPSRLEGKGRERNRERKESAAKEPRTPRKRDLLVDTLAESTGSDPAELTRPHARALGVAVASIREVAPDVSPDEIRRRAANYARMHPDWELTGPALAKHWAECGGVSSVAGPWSNKLGGTA